MTVGARVRFEVFKRDGFTCQYCGERVPNVLLEVDHIVPRAAGGSDEITNLTTSCTDCNSGKSDRLLEEGTAPTVNRAVVDDLRERLEQAAAYTELVGQQTNLVNKQIGLITDLWAKAFGATAKETAEGSYWVFESYGRWPEEGSLRTFLRRLPMHELVAAVDITSSHFNSSTAGACKFFYKICWNRIKGLSGPIDEPGPVERGPDFESLYLGAARQLELAEDVIAEKDERIAELNATVERLKEDVPRRPWSTVGEILRTIDIGKGE